MKRFAIAVAALVILAGAGWFVVQRLGPASPDGTLYGNVEIRQVDLAFNSEGTVTAMHKREGDRPQRARRSPCWTTLPTAAASPWPRHGAMRRRRSWTSC
ncbi:MAG: hypothetical protein ACJ8AW_35320 [Rhodopila sp.]